MATPKWFLIAFMLSLSLAQTLSHKVTPLFPSDDPSSEPEARKIWSWKNNVAASLDASTIGYGSGSGSGSDSDSDSDSGSRYRGGYGSVGEPDPGNGDVSSIVEPSSDSNNIGYNIGSDSETSSGYKRGYGSGRGSDSRYRGGYGDVSGKKWGAGGGIPGYGGRPGTGGMGGGGIPGYGGAPGGTGGGWGGTPGLGLPPYVPNMPPGYRPPVVGYGPIPQIGYPPEGGVFYCAPQGCWTGNPITCRQQGFSINLNEPMFNISKDKMGMKDKRRNQANMEAMAPESG